jgi:lipoyl(octanoyl) transferase
MARRRCICEWIGRVGYAAGLALQEGWVSRIQAGDEEDRLFLLEHPHVLTLGRNAQAENVLLSLEELRARGATVHEVGRGGDVTYHGPGQLVGYSILSLIGAERDAHDYLRWLEEVLLLTLADFSIEARRHPPHTGVWVGDNKIAAIGVRFSRWVSSHGFALNVDCELDWFSTIVPCGIRDYGVTSMEELLGEAPDAARVRERLLWHFGRVMQREVVIRVPRESGAEACR